jgi:hypothetical protein
MKHAYLLQHERPDTGDVKVIGIYSSRESAAAAIERLRTQPGFRDHPDGFAIDRYALDRDHWSEGFLDL